MGDLLGSFALTWDSASKASGFTILSESESTNCEWAIRVKISCSGKGIIVNHETLCEAIGCCLEAYKDNPAGKSKIMEIARKEYFRRNPLPKEK